MSVDVTTPSKRVRAGWEWIDLEIDLVRASDGNAGIEDGDEFADAFAAGHINHAERVEALRITPVLERMLRERAEPFGDVGRRRLSDALALGLPAL
jgi:predicted RNA-binding protein associated with RNAse of E/G family